MIDPTNVLPYRVTDRNLALELVRVTEAAAIASDRWTGRGLKNDADGAAVQAMRAAFDTVAIDGVVTCLLYTSDAADEQCMV